MFCYILIIIIILSYFFCPTFQVCDNNNNNNKIQNIKKLNLTFGMNQYNSFDLKC